MARQFGVTDKNLIHIQTIDGTITQKVHVTDNIRPGVVLADFGWWFPEKDLTEHNLQDANINMLTRDEGPFSPEIGSTNFRSIACTISPAG
jgi:anaerobic selenocysteine-containing dehydrogenase